MSASLCWIAWNEPIGTSNWMRCLAYSSDMSKRRRAVPTNSAATATVARSRKPSIASESTARDGAVPVDDHLEHAPGGVERADRPHGRRPDQSDPWPAGDDRDPVDPVGLGHEGPHRIVVHPPEAVGTRHRHRAGGLAGQHFVQELVVGDGEERGEERGRGEERARRGHVPGLFEEEAQIGHRAFAQRRELAQVLPERVGRGRVVDVRPQQRGRALAREQLLRGLLHQLLMTRQREVHQLPLGRPRTRWAMMLRWISDEPPAMVPAKLVRKPRRPAALLVAAFRVDRPRRTGPAAPSRTRSTPC